MNILPAISATADALHAEKTRMDVIAQNIANAQNTRDVDGKPYQRKVVAFEAVLGDQLKGEAAGGVKIAGIVADESAGPSIFDPQHPHANDQGMVQLPNVQVSKEMVDLISASRAYEANLTVVRTSREMARQTLSIGR